ARVTGVPVVLLVGVLTAGQDDLVGVDDDDVVTVVDVRREGSFVLAAETVGDDGCQTAEDNTLSVDQHPLLHHVRRLLRKGSHGFCLRLILPASSAVKAFLVACVAGSELTATEYGAPFEAFRICGGL